MKACNCRVVTYNPLQGETCLDFPVVCHMLVVFVCAVLRFIGRARTQLPLRLWPMASRLASQLLRPPRFHCRLHVATKILATPHRERRSSHTLVHKIKPRTHPT